MDLSKTNIPYMRTVMHDIIFNYHNYIKI